MSSEKMDHLLRLVPFCDYRCRLCQCIGCTSATLVEVAEAEESSIVERAAHGVTTFIVPSNFAFYPERDRLFQIAKANHAALRVFVSLENLIDEKREMLSRHLSQGGAVDFVIETVSEAPLVQWLKQLLAVFQDQIRFTFLISRDLGNLPAFATVPQSWLTRIFFHSPEKASSDDRFLTCDELFDFFEGVFALYPELEIRASGTFKISAEPFCLPVAKPSSFHRRRLRSLAVQRRYRAEFERGYYLANLHQMGDFPVLRLLIDAFLSCRFWRVATQPIYGLTWRLQAKIFATTTSSGRLHGAAMRPFTIMNHQLRTNLWRWKYPYYKLVHCYHELLRIYRMVCLLRYRLITLVDWVGAQGRRIHHLVRMSGHSVRRLWFENGWFFRNPDGWLQERFPIARWLITQPLLKAYFFIGYQFRTRLFKARDLAKPPSPRSNMSSHRVGAKDK